MCNNYPTQTTSTTSTATSATTTATAAVSASPNTSTSAAVNTTTEYPLTEQGFRQFIRNRGGKVPTGDMNVSVFMLSLTGL